jgi:hypothetical protein
MLFYNPFWDKSVIVVGNSPKILGKNLGKFIDSHDIVVRINKFQIDGYEKDVGTKCNALHVNECVTKKNFDKIFSKYFQNILWMGTRNRKKFCKKFEFSWYDWRIQEYEKHGHLTSGLSVILHIVSMINRPLHIVGIGGHSDPGYYYDQSQKCIEKITNDMDQFHDRNTEHKILKNLENSLKILRINI